MFTWLRPALRHPLFPDLRSTRAAGATGRHAVLAGNFPELAEAARQGASAARALFVLHSGDSPLPGASQRDLLWQWFGVPAYVLVLDAAGRVTAYECEAREDLHLAAAAGGAGESQSSLCPCGRPGRRVSSAPRRSRPIVLQQPRAHSLSA